MKKNRRRWRRERKRTRWRGKEIDRERRGERFMKWSKMGAGRYGKESTCRGRIRRRRRREL